MINKKNYLLLKNAKTRKDLAEILGLSASFITLVLYRQGINNNYSQFTINKKSGGVRTINAPSPSLKDIQRRLSNLLQDCNEVIREDNEIDTDCIVSHGFERKKSIITNADVHKRKKNVLNLDLENFFEGFNFGRVRGFFISNKNYKLDPLIATVIAQIACHNNCLPQGSPCSPVIANIITSSLDMRLLRLAKREGCAYSRYADDITFSTRKKEFPKSIIQSLKPLNLGSKLRGEIRRAGFSVNNRKTRLQYKDSRQEATGLIINKKLGIKSEYVRLTRAMAHRLFKTGTFTISSANIDEETDNVKKLEGRLTFIDSIDRINNVLESEKPIPPYGIIKTNDFKKRHNSRESVYSRFLFYKHFHGNNYTTILTEGKTDNIYLKSALFGLKNLYPELIEQDGTLKLNIPNLNKKTAYFLDLGDGATSFVKFYKRYTKEKSFFGMSSKAPVIMILDNDSGPSTLIKEIADNLKKKGSEYPQNTDDVRRCGFIHLLSNLYIILTPLKNGSDYSEMEDLFYKNTKSIRNNGKKFSTESDFDISKYYGKNDFATRVVRPRKSSINFRKFRYIFNEIENVIEHFNNHTS